MRPTSHQHAAFVSGEALPGVAYKHNAAVRVTAGDCVGELGAIVSVEELGSDPIYLVELGSGKDVRVRQSCLDQLE